MRLSTAISRSSSTGSISADGLIFTFAFKIAVGNKCAPAAPWCSFAPVRLLLQYYDETVFLRRLRNKNALNVKKHLWVFNKANIGEFLLLKAPWCYLQTEILDAFLRLVFFEKI